MIGYSGGNNLCVQRLTCRAISAYAELFVYYCKPCRFRFVFNAEPVSISGNKPRFNIIVCTATKYRLTNSMDWKLQPTLEFNYIKVNYWLCCVWKCRNRTSIGESYFFSLSYTLCWRMVFSSLCDKTADQCCYSDQSLGLMDLHRNSDVSLRLVHANALSETVFAFFHIFAFLQIRLGSFVTNN